MLCSSTKHEPADRYKPTPQGWRRFWLVLQINCFFKNIFRFDGYVSVCCQNRKTNSFLFIISEENADKNSQGDGQLQDGDRSDDGTRNRLADTIPEQNIEPQVNNETDTREQAPKRKATEEGGPLSKKIAKEQRKNLTNGKTFKMIVVLSLFSRICIRILAKSSIKLNLFLFILFNRSRQEAIEK